MSEVIPVKFNPVTIKHEPFEEGDTIPAIMAAARPGEIDYYPQAHISPPLIPTKRVWLNDPQPFLYDRESQTYYLWYLYNEDYDNEEGTAWREVLTKDFVTFTDNGVRIPKFTTDYGDIWSGSAFLDEKGLFGHGEGAVLYYVTMPCNGKSGPGKQSVALWAAPQGLGYTPEFVGIVIQNADADTFRDPRVFLGDDGHTLYMLIAVEGGVACFSSTDGMTWSRASTLLIPGLGTIECPDLVKLGGSTVLVFSGNGYQDAPVTTQTMFLLVNFSYGSLTLAQKRPADIQRMCLDAGPDFYAGRCGQTSTGDNIMLGWANNWNYAENLPIPDFNGTLALPRVLSLHTYSDGYVGVVGMPIGKQTSFYARTVSQAGISLSGDYSPIPWVDVPESSRIDFTIRKDPNNGWPKTFGLFIGSGDVKSFSTTVSMTGDGTGNNQPYFENTRNDFGARPNYSIKEWNEYYRTYLDEAGDTLQGTIVVDRGTAEVFINGVYAHTFQVLWPIGAQYMRMSIPEGYTLSGDFTLRYNRRPGRVNGGFTRAHADSIYMFNDVPVVTSYSGDANNPHTHRILQIAADDRRGPFFQTTYGGPYFNFWQINPDDVGLLVYTMSNSYVKSVRQVFIDNDPEKGVGFKADFGGDTVYVPTQTQFSAMQTSVSSTDSRVSDLSSQVGQNQSALGSVQGQLQQVSLAVSQYGSRISQNQKDIETNSNAIGNIGGQVKALSSQTDALNSRVNSTTQSVQDIQNRLLTGNQSGSPNTAGNPNLLDRYPITQADVAKFLFEGAQQKAQGLAYAGKYALTPQNFYVNSDGVLRLTPYGAPPTDGTTTTPLNRLAVPIITDACSVFYDRDAGIWYRWDQFQYSSQEYQFHWDLDGPVVSVSVDGLKWVSLRTLLFAQTGSGTWTAFWVDRDNRVGMGAGALIVGSTGATYAMPNLTAASGTRVTGALYSGGDFRLYYDPEVFKGFVVLAVNSSNTGLEVHSGKSLTTMNAAFSFNDPIFSGLRVECPSWLPMFDQVTGTKMQVVSAALQATSGHATDTGFESCALGVGSYTTTGLTLSSELRYVEWGADAYAHVIADPMQQDGTGGVRNGCDSAVYNVGSWNWSYINQNRALPSFGFGGGQHIEAKVVLRNGVPYILPGGRFETACSGRTFTQQAFAQGTNATNPGWTLSIPFRSDVWRAKMLVENFTFSGRSTIRFHFQDRYADYIFGLGTIDFNPNNSGTTVLVPNQDSGSVRRMPLSRPFVSGSENTLVWEYDNGRIRLYNTATGEIMSEKIFPDGHQLTGVEVLGDDFFVGGFVLTVAQDGGTNY